MTGTLRVFVSSTMNDLINERMAVVDKLKEFNFEPVNAEGILPTGQDSWDRIAGEIASCHVFALILGDRYGWIPQSGPHAEDGLSVTELEYREARRLGMPILPFFKTLTYGADSATEDAQKRDRFRQEVAQWDGGTFRAEFRLARDLGHLVAKSVIGLISDNFISRTVAPREAPSGSNDSGPISRLALPDRLVQAVLDRSAVLFAGAGMSLQSGLPSAAAFTEALMERIRTVDPDYKQPIQGSAFHSVASDVETILGAAALHDAVRALIAVQDTTVPSTIQTTAVRAFDLIVTTNYDTLLEAADQDSRLMVVGRDLRQGALEGAALVKLHGSFDDPSWLVATESDLIQFNDRRANLLESVRRQLRTRPLIVVGSSLRDPSIVSLFNDCRPEINGWIVAPLIGAVDQRRAASWGLEPVQASASDFFASIDGLRRQQ